MLEKLKKKKRRKVLWIQINASKKNTFYDIQRKKKKEKIKSIFEKKH